MTTQYYKCMGQVDAPRVLANRPLLARALAGASLEAIRRVSVQDQHRAPDALQVISPTELPDEFRHGCWNCGFV